MFWRTLRKLKVGHEFEKIGAAEVLAGSKRKRAFLALAHAMSDENWRVQRAAEAALHVMAEANRSALPQWLPTLRNSFGMKERTVAMAAIRSACPVATDDLLVALEHDDPRIREQAAKGLAGCAEYRALELLGRHLNDSSSEVRYAAATALTSSPITLIVPKTAGTVLSPQQDLLPSDEPETSSSQCTETRRLHSELVANALKIVEECELPKYRSKLLEPLREAGRGNWADDDNETLRRKCSEAVNRDGLRAMAAVGPILVKVLRDAGPAYLGCIHGIIPRNALAILLHGGSTAVPWVLQVPLLEWTPYFKGSSRVGSPDEDVVDFIGEYGSDDASIAILLQRLGVKSVNAEKGLAALRQVLGRCIVMLPVDRLCQLSNLPNPVQAYGEVRKTFDSSDIRAMAGTELAQRKAFVEAGE